MKKSTVIIIILSLFVVMLSGTVLYMHFEQPKLYVKKDELSEENLPEFDLTSDTMEVTKRVLKGGCIRDSETAEIIAKGILTSVYGEKIDNDLPLVVLYDESKGFWNVRTQIPESITKGGSAYIVLNKENAEVVAIWAEA